MSNSSLNKFHTRSRAQGILYAIMAYTLWGILPIYWKALKQIPAGQILAHRIFWSFLFLAFIISSIKKWGDFKLAFKSTKGILAVTLGSILISVNWLIYIWAVNHDKIVEASLGYYINPLFTIALGIIVLKEKFDFWQIISILLAFCGVGFLTYQYGQVPWIALSLAITFAIYGLVKKMSSLSSLTGLTAETLMVAPLALAFLIYSISGEWESYSTYPLNTLVLMVLTGVVTATPLLLFAQGAKSVSLSTLGFIQYLSPSMSLVIGIFVYKEPFTSVEIISFGCIWMALIMYSFSRKEVLFYILKRFK